MDRGLYVAMTGAKQIMQAQAVNNHNIANINTVGFRADAVSFASQPIYGPGYPTRVNAVAGDAGTDFSSGVMQGTGRDLDIAVNGKGYIAVIGQRRQGSLHARRRSAGERGRRRDHRGSGQPVLTESGPLNIPPATTVTVGNDGTISVVPLGLNPIAHVADGPHQAGESAAEGSAEGRRRAAAAQGRAARPTPIRTSP